MPFTKPANTGGTHKQAKVKLLHQPSLEPCIGLKAVPSPSKLLSFAFRNFSSYRDTTPVPLLVPSGKRTKGQCTAVPGTEITFMNSTCHQRGVWVGGVGGRGRNASSSPKNEWRPIAHRMCSLSKGPGKLAVSATRSVVGCPEPPLSKSSNISQAPALTTRPPTSQAEREFLL